MKARRTTSSTCVMLPPMPLASIFVIVAADMVDYNVERPERTTGLLLLCYLRMLVTNGNINLPKMLVTLFKGFAAPLVERSRMGKEIVKKEKEEEF
jgi:hypothetical protein